MKYDPNASAYGAQPVMNLGMGAMSRPSIAPYMQNAHPFLQNLFGYGQQPQMPPAQFGNDAMMPSLPPGYEHLGAAPTPQMQAQPAMPMQMPSKANHYGLQAGHGGPVQMQPAQQPFKRFF